MDRLDFELLFDRLPSPHMVLDHDFAYVGVNQAYERAVMRQRGELIGRNLFDMFPNDGESGKRLRASLSRVFETGESDTLAYIPYEIPKPDSPSGEMEQRFWTAVHTPLVGKDGKTRFLMQNTVDVTDVARLREAFTLPYRSGGAELQLIERAREAEAAHRALLAESADFRRLFKQAPQMMAVLSGPDHVFTFTNDAYQRFVGDRQVIGLPVREALPEVRDQGFFELLDEVFSEGKEHSGENVRIVVEQSHGISEAFLDFSYRPIRDAMGEVSGVFVQGMDRTAAVRDARHQRVLQDELNHRVKNTLATVQSIASQTLRNSSDMEAARKGFEGRIVALSKAHNLLSARRWASIELRKVAEQQFLAYDQSRIGMTGPSASLNSKATIAVAMLLHELVDNAAKFGALSVPGGRIDLDWRLTEGESGSRLTLTWSESGGPLVARPSHRGFGARMLDRVAEGELGGTLTMDYAPEGFFCQIEIPAESYAKMENAVATH